MVVARMEDVGSGGRYYESVRHPLGTLAEDHFLHMIHTLL